MRPVHLLDVNWTRKKESSGSANVRSGRVGHIELWWGTRALRVSVVTVGLKKFPLIYLTQTSNGINSPSSSWEFRMAFEGHQSAFANSLFSTYQRQVGLNVGGGSDGSVALPLLSIPSGSLQDTASYMPWSHNAHDDPYELSCAQSSIKNRKPTDNTDFEVESDLQGLVSNILDEADSQDSYYSEGRLPKCNSIWSPKTLKEELLQYFQSDAKVQHNPNFPRNYVSGDPFSKTQGQSVVRDVEEFCQHSNGLAANQQWLFNLPNGDRDSYTLQPQKLPPGLSVPHMGNTYLSQTHQTKYDNMSADRGNTQHMNDFFDLSEVFRPQSEMNSSFDPYYEDRYTQSSTMANSTEQYVPKAINQLVSSFQSFMAGERDNFCHEDFTNGHKQMLGIHNEDSTSPPMSTQSTPAVQTPKQLVGEFGIVQTERNGGLRKQAFQDLPGFSPQNTEYFQQPKLYSGSLNHPNQYQNNITMHRENTPMNISQYSKHHIQQGQIQSKIKSQLRKDKTVMHMPVFLGDGLMARPLTNNYTREGEKKQALTQNPYFDLQGSMQSQKLDRGKHIVSVGNSQQFMPFMCTGNDPSRPSSNPINSNFSSRGTLPYGSGVPGMDVVDMVSANDSTVFNSYVGDMMTHRGDTTYQGMASAVTIPMVMNQGGPVIQLYFFLDECYEQWRCLEKERKRTEVILTKTFAGKRTTAVTNTTQPKTPPNPTRVDHLIVRQLREQAKVASLLDRMECLCNSPLHMNIHTALNRHHMAICITQSRRKEEIANMSKQQEQRAHFSEDRDTLLLVLALKDLAATTRKVRTALWCALQITLPKPVKRQVHHVEEATCSERCSSPFEGYSFKL